MREEIIYIRTTIKFRTEKRIDYAFLWVNRMNTPTIVVRKEAVDSVGDLMKVYL